MWTIIARTAIQILAGLGIGEMLDKFVRPKAPEYFPTSPLAAGAFRQPLKLVWLLVIFIIATFVLKFLGKKLKISILK